MNDIKKISGFDVSGNRGSRTEPWLAAQFDARGRELLDGILAMDSPNEFIQNLPYGDFYWLIKAIGEGDSPAVLEMADIAQWQYIIDMEIWRKDRLVLDRTEEWLSLLAKSDPDQLSRWLLGEGKDLAFFFFNGAIEIVVVDADEPVDLPESYFTFDGVYYIRVHEEKHAADIKGILASMADRNYPSYQNFLLDILSVTPTELEEALYRFRSIRMAEHGLVPFDEALDIYSPFESENLKWEAPDQAADIWDEADLQDMLPDTPLMFLDEKQRFSVIAANIRDETLYDKVKFEFYGLGGRILSADASPGCDIEAVMEAYRKVGGYLSVAFEHLGVDNMGDAERLLKASPLKHIFQVGYGRIMKIHWEAKRWVSKSWFTKAGLSPEFWGERQGGVLIGLLMKRPKRYDANEASSYREFNNLADAADSLNITFHLMLLDGLLDRLTSETPLSIDASASPDLTLPQLLFTYWARRRLGLEIGFEPLQPNDAQKFLKLLTASEPRPKNGQAGWPAEFSSDFIAYISMGGQKAESSLSQALEEVWTAVFDEYSGVLQNREKTPDLKYLGFILVRSSD